MNYMKDALQFLAFCVLTGMMIGFFVILAHTEFLSRNEKLCMKYYPKVPMEQCIWEHNKYRYAMKFQFTPNDFAKYVEANDINATVKMLQIAQIANQALQEKFNGLPERIASDLLYVDGHSWSNRPCQTCRAVSGLFGFDFGCTRYAKEKR